MRRTFALVGLLVGFLVLMACGGDETDIPRVGEIGGAIAGQ